MNEYDELARLQARYPGSNQASPGMASPMQPGGGSVGAMGGSLSPELVQAILSMQQQGQKQSGVERSRALAQKLRADSAGQLQGRQAGNVYVAPGLLNAAANIYGNYKAGKMEQDADLREQNMGVQSQDALRKYFEALTGRKPQPVPYMGGEGE